MTKLSIAILLPTLLFLCACQTRLHPVVMPIDDETRARVNELWNAVLKSPAAPDRELVLDAIVMGELHHMGVDRFWFRSEKKFEGGWVVLSNYYDRSAFQEGQFTVEVFDHDRLLLSRLTYSDKEVIQVMNDLRRVVFKGSVTMPDGAEVSSPTQAAEEQVEARKKRIEDLVKKRETKAE